MGNKSSQPAPAPEMLIPHPHPHAHHHHHHHRHHEHFSVKSYNDIMMIVFAILVIYAIYRYTKH